MASTDRLPPHPTGDRTATPLRAVRLAAANDNRPPGHRLVGWMVLAAAVAAAIAMTVSDWP